jgi:signal transduction histidine kinase/AraC-like DNA-binding protein/ligand-binding sensor domain-containing protein
MCPSTAKEQTSSGGKISNLADLYVYGLLWHSGTARFISLFVFVFILFTSLTPLLAVSRYTPSYTDPLTELYRWQLIPELSGKGCRCMVEDKSGTVWFGVKGGVLAYDGIHWQFHSIHPAWSNDPVVALCATADGCIYAGTPKGICRYQNAEWQYLDIHLGFADSLDFPNNRLPIIETADSSIWIGTHQGALRIKNDRMEVFNKDHLYENTGKIHSGFANQSMDSMSLCNIYCLYEEQPDRMWVGLTNGSIYTFSLNDHYPATGPKWQRMDTQPGFIMGEFPSINKNNNLVYIVSQESNRGINIYDGHKWQTLDLGSRYGVDNIHTELLQSWDRSMWLGGLAHLYSLKNGQWNMYDATELPLPANRLFLYETRDHSMWIGGLGSEVWRIDLATPRWTTFNELNFQGETPGGEKWFLALNGQIVSCDSSMTKWRSYDVSDGIMDTPTAILLTRRGGIWAAGSHNLTAATAWFDGTGWHRQLHDKLAWGIDYRAIFESGDGSIWFGSSSDPNIITLRGYLGGLAQCKPPADGDPKNITFNYHYFDQNFRLYGIYGIGQDCDGLLWTGQLGLCNYNLHTGLWKNLYEPKGLVENFIDCIHDTPAGNLWFGTRSNGLFRLDSRTHQWTNFTAEDGLSSNTIISIYAKSDSDVWVATDQDICHFDGYSWVANVFPTHIKMTSSGGALRISADGSLWINQLSRAWNRRALYQKTDLPKTTNIYKTIRYRPEYLAPETMITFSQERVSPPGNVLVSWTARDPWKSTPDQQLQYSYRLDHGPWSNYTNKTNELFLSVADGDHTFQVRARDRDMNVDPIPAKVAFYVVPPTWRQPWFITLIITFLTTIGYFLVRLLHRNKIIQELSEAKLKVFANISHEFRTPLTLIMGPLHQIQGSLQPGNPWLKQFDMMYRNCMRLMRLVNQVLDFQKIEAGQLRLEPSQDDVIAFIKKVAATFESIAREKQIVFQIDTNVAGYRMSFDPDKLEKILYNLLSNSFKFTNRQGTITINLQVCAIPHPVENSHSSAPPQKELKQWLEIQVRDNGIGIPKKDLPLIFDRFYQGDDRSHLHRGGTGIGLALVKELVSLHNGEIQVESEEGKGAIFRIRLPLPQTEDSLTLGSSHLEEPTFLPSLISPRTPKRILKRPEKELQKAPLILLVEDNADMCEYIRSDLQARYRILQAQNGRDGLTLALQHRLDLIISDVMMPEMNGIEFCKMIKNDERTSHIPIILLTARSSYLHKIEGLETGADDYITKPFHTRELEIRIHNLIHSRKILRERFSKQVRIEPKEITITSTDEKFLLRAIEIIENHLDDPDYSVDFFSRDIGMSRVGLYHKLKALTDLSVQEFIFALRLKRAAQLLKQSGLNITEVAYQVGFKDSSHFTKLFKKHFGIPPSAFIKQNS